MGGNLISLLQVVEIAYVINDVVLLHYKLDRHCASVSDLLCAIYSLG